MDPVVQGAIITVAGTLALAVIGGFIKIIWGSINDRKFFNQLKDKIGNTDDSTLSKQHDAIKETITERASIIENTIKKMQNNDFTRIFNKVDSIDKLLIQKEAENRFRMESMNENQKEIKSHMQGISKLADDWEKTIAENKELKVYITELEKKYMELEKQYKDLSFKYRKEKSRENDIER